jgi:hypothetical protein
MTPSDSVVLQLLQAVADPTIRSQLANILAQQLRLEPSKVEQMLAVAGRPITRPMALTDGETVAAIFQRAGLSVELKRYAEPVSSSPPPLTQAPEPTAVEASVSPVEPIHGESVPVSADLETDQKVRIAAVWLGYIGVAACFLINFLLNTRTSYGWGWGGLFLGIAPSITLLEPIRSGQQPLTVSRRVAILLWSWITISVAGALIVFTYLVPVWLVPFLESHNLPELSGWTYLLIWIQIVGFSIGILTQVAEHLGFVPTPNSAESMPLMVQPEAQPAAAQALEEIASTSSLMTPLAAEVGQLKPEKATRRLGFTGIVHLGCKWLIGLWTVLCVAAVGFGSLNAFADMDSQSGGAGTMIGVTAGLVVIFFFWLVPVAMLAVIAFLTRSRVVPGSATD